jgi:acetamidase/formamidase
MTLEIQIDDIVVGSWGWTAAGFPHPNNERLGIADKYTYHLWDLDPDALRGRNQHGFEINLRPFMGVMGMPPDEPGILPTAPPRATGGNLDCRELVPGTSLFLPIAVDGGLFSVGDGHAAQGDGEVCVTAIECGMDCVTLTFHVHDDMPLKGPRIKTPESWITLGVHTDLQEATYLALEDMLDLMGEHYSLSRSDAIALASLVVDMRITQIANGVQGVHAVLRHDAITAPRA